MNIRGAKPWRCALAAGAAMALLVVSCWVTRSIYCLSFSRDIAGGGALGSLTRGLGTIAPDFLLPLKYPGGTRTISLGLVILGICGIALGVLSRRGVPVIDPVEAGASPAWRFNSFIRSAGLAAGFACLAVLLIRVSLGRAFVNDILLWVGAALAFGLAIADRPMRRVTLILSRVELIILLAASAGVAVFYMSGSMWWVYSFCGDEYEYLDMAKNIVKDMPSFNPFSQYGVGSGTIPLGISYAQVGVMKLLGVNNFGWRASSAIFAVACFIPFYCYMKFYFSRMAAAASTGLMAFSFYLTTWARTGKPHNHVNTFYCLALGCYAWFKNSPSRTKAYISGALLGAGFYFFHSAKFAFIFFLLLYAVDCLKERSLRKLEYATAFATAFLVVVAPCMVDYNITDVMAVTRKYAVANWVGETLHGANPAGTMDYVVRNSIYLFFCPFYYAWHDGAYIHRTVTDWLTAALMGLGLGWSMVWAFRRRQVAALLLTYAAAIVLIGGTVPCDYPQPTRTLWAFPWWAALAGIGAWRLLELGYAYSLTKKGMWCWCIVGLSVALALNLWQLYVVVPSAYDLISPSALIVKQVQSEPSSERHIYFIGTDVDGVPQIFAIMAAQLYGYEDRFHALKNSEVLGGGFPASVVRPSLFVVDSRNKEEKRMRSYLKQLFPHYREKNELALSGQLNVYMLYVERDTGVRLPPL